MNKLELQYNPFSSKLEKETDENFADWYENKFKQVSLSARLALSGEIAEQEVENICNKFGISDWQKIGYVARIIRDIFCDNLREMKIKEQATQKVGIKKEDLAVFLQLIRESVKRMIQTGEREYDEIIDKITLKEAIKKYPEIQNQKISDENLEAENGEYLVSGTIRNWLEDYFQRAGGSKHDSYERSEYLFKAESVRLLDNEEKNKLGVILKAFDDESLVAVRKEEKEIDFNETILLDEGKKKLNGIISGYDNDPIRVGFPAKKIIEKEEKIESMPRFDVDEREKKEFSKISENMVSLKEKETEIQEKNKENRKNNQNVLDLSDYV